MIFLYHKAKKQLDLISLLPFVIVLLKNVAVLFWTSFHLLVNG